MSIFGLFSCYLDWTSSSFLPKTQCQNWSASSHRPSNGIAGPWPQQFETPVYKALRHKFNLTATTVGLNMEDSCKPSKFAIFGKSHERKSRGRKLLCAFRRQLVRVGEPTHSSRDQLQIGSSKISGLTIKKHIFWNTRCYDHIFPISSSLGLKPPLWSQLHP